MHCGKAPCGITSSARAGNAAHRLSRRGGASGVPRRPRRGACAHHRVERTDRDARHEVRSTRSRATSSTKPPPTAAPREPARRQRPGRWRRPLQRSDRGGFEARVTLPGSQLRLPRAGNWNSGGRGTPYGVTHTHFALVSRSAPVSKFRRCCKQNIRLAVASFLEI
jgi:hypothetical protein